MNHRSIRIITHDICNNFYIQIKNEKDWEKVNGLSKEYDKKYSGDEFCRDLIRVYVNEWYRSNRESEENDG